MTTPSPATLTRIQTSQHMTDFQRRLERKILEQHKRKLTQQELMSELFRAAARVYADAMIAAERRHE